ncbi:small GTP-binding protein, putative [Trichomonas vaginalis G3]|uniref:Small GTP-binding protein, putative n=1 Tax=Trichomonas vaginalis (strain ATCC PRA-98 / G3) TaxID=412133 RepID=A2E8M0_TRIV3|nr:GTPase protein [Trichomonas vaginalis G3]EAY10959.1 small GTP-binding protein, putative [Trichomonas vaginalis G3]KAI5530848.1 GTPase protein [Trichomonas vaginalis G3]|eukprot:XP_001323182.1 small GTP-binding protein [Trichomonas vaginalis G3]
MNSYTFKFLLVGDQAVGKTSLVHRLCRNTYSDNSEETVGVEFMPYNLNIDKTQIKLQIWDTAGQEQYRSLAKAYFRNAVGVVLFFAINDHLSFQHLETWLNDIRSLCHKNCRILLVGSKIDLIEERKITKDEIQKFVENFDLEYIETSAKENTNIKETFYKLAQEVLHSVQKGDIVLGNPSNSVQPTAETEPKKSCC